MDQKRYPDQGILRILREIELVLASGWDVATACRTAGVNATTYYRWHYRFGGIGRSEMGNLMALQKENDRLKKIMEELELNTLTLKESLGCLVVLFLEGTSETTIMWIADEFGDLRDW